MKVDPDAFFLDGVQSRGRPNLVIYSSCHTWQLWEYFHRHRPEEIAHYNLSAAVLHNIASDPGVRCSEELRNRFRDADIILYHEMDPTRFAGMLLSDFPLKPDVRLIKLPSPQASCFWPVIHRFSERPIRKLIDRGLDLPEIRRRFHMREIDFCYGERFVDDIARTTEREAGCTIKTVDFLMRNLQRAKMFLTLNHPSFHLIAYIGDRVLQELGHEPRGEEHCLATDVNEAGFGNHHPETESEFRHYQFQYPMRFPDGADDFYLAQIDAIYADHLHYLTLL